jgi:serine/threonine protein kinase
MPLGAGTQLGHYKVQSLIGMGGMGEVYRAVDTKLEREVAIKVLPAALADDAERLARFEREAKVLAQLNHPGIAAIHGVEDRALVMELVPGPTLADRIKEGPIPASEAEEILLQIADALEYAHERGVIHRDLKPANIKIDPDGRVKILDFGLAKALTDPGGSIAGDPTNSPTVSLTIGGTVAGTLLGTAAYMAPEQARGKKVDKRADIWAFGVVAWEMLTGERLFQGEDTVQVLGRVAGAEDRSRPRRVALPPTPRALPHPQSQGPPARHRRSTIPAQRLRRYRCPDRATPAIASQFRALGSRLHRAPCTRRSFRDPLPRTAASPLNVRPLSIQPRETHHRLVPPIRHLSRWNQAGLLRRRERWRFAPVDPRDGHARITSFVR